MSFSTKWLTLAAFTAALFLTGCGLSLAEDVTPPPNYRGALTPVADNMGGQASAGQSQPTQSTTQFPLVPPDPAQGVAIYTEKCAPCHGETGLGDGAQASNLPNPAAPIGKAEFARQSRPVDWYAMVTNGNLEKFMPGFTSLNDRQRWDVVAYAYTLSFNPQSMQQTSVVFSQNCAACHGEHGGGDGPQAASLKTAPISWSKDQENLVALTGQDIAGIIASGKGEMPAFGDKIDEAQRLALADYVRALSFAAGANAEASASGTAAATTEAAAGTPEPGATAGAAPTTAGTAVPDGTAAPATTAAPAGTAAARKVTIQGQVSNGTTGGKLPTGMKATLLGYTDMTQADERSTDVSADGKFTFKDVESNANIVYLVRVDFNGLSFNSDILHDSDIKGDTAELPVKIYDASEDASALVADRLHVFFDFSTEGKVQVVNLYILSNPTDKVITAKTGQPVLTFDLPKEATNLQFQDGQLGGRFIQTANGFGDTLAVTPGVGQHQILFGYDLPYTGQQTITLKPPMTVDAAIVMAPPGISVKSDALAEAGKQDVQGMSYSTFQSKQTFASGQTVTMEISGKSGATTQTQGNGLTNLMIGLGAFGLVLVGTGIFLFTLQARQKKAALAAADGAALAAEGAAGEDSEALLDQIVALDDLHASGELSEEIYQQRRKELKARLAEALRREQ